MKKFWTIITGPNSIFESIDGLATTCFSVVNAYSLIKNFYHAGGMCTIKPGVATFDK